MGDSNHPNEPDPPPAASSLELGYGKWMAKANSADAIETLERIAKDYRPVVIVAILSAILGPLLAMMCWWLLRHS